MLRTGGWLHFNDRDMLRRLLADAGFRDIALETVTLTARAQSVGRRDRTGDRHPTFAAMQELRVTDPGPIIDALATARAREGGTAPFEVPMQAVVLFARA